MPGTEGEGEGAAAQDRKLTFLCFGAPDLLEQRFELLDRGEKWKQAVQEPSILFQIVFDELYQQLDAMAWRLSGVFGDLEHVRPCPFLQRVLTQIRLS